MPTKMYIVMGEVDGYAKRADFRVSTSAEAIAKFIKKMEDTYMVDNTHITNIKACIRGSGVK